jgi:hypothetical protein
MSAPRAGPIALALVAVLLAAVPRAALAVAAYPLSLSVMGGDARPELLLAQRAIERQWGPAEDSVYVEIEIPEWRSEGLAGALSAAVPGAGQLYAGDSRGVWYALAELVGWTARSLYRGRGHELQDDAAHFAGPPTDSTSRWSFTRWSQTTHQDPASLIALYDADRQAFYDLIGHDARYLAGWDGDPAATRSVFAGYRGNADARLRYGRYVTIGMWLNHLVSGLDALRVARLHNLPLRRNLDLRVRGGWRHGTPNFVLALERRF